MKSDYSILKQDFVLLRPQLIKLAVTLLICIVVYISFSLIKNTFSLRLQNKSYEHTQISTAMNQFVQNQDITEIYLSNYRNLSNSGLLAAEDRLFFLDTIKTIRDINSLFPVSIELGEQSNRDLNYDESIEFPGSTVTLNNSKVELSLPLLHEGDFFIFLESLNEYSAAIIPVRCDIGWYSQGELSLNSNAPNLQSNCDFQWLSFNLDPVLEDDYEE